MYKTMLVSSNPNTEKIFNGLRIWGETVDFYLAGICHNGTDALKKMKTENFTLIIVDIEINGMKAEELVKRIKREKLCRHIVLYSAEPDIEYARQGIILGAFDYFFGQPDKAQLLRMFNRINRDTIVGESFFIHEAEQLIESFVSNRQNFSENLTNIEERLNARSENASSLSENFRRLYEIVADTVFLENEWLGLYLDRNIIKTANSGIQEEYTENIKILFNEYNLLFPETEDETLRLILIYILSNPEEDLGLKILADRFWVNNTYLSTVFKANLHMNFADYLTLVKMKRSAYLLVNTDRTVNDISMDMGYSQPWYFSGLFKKIFEQTPSEYRKSRTI